MTAQSAPATASAAAPLATAATHYENFPVASWLCPPHLRPAIQALYTFARTADDLADEGDTPSPQRLADLAQYRQDLRHCAAQTSQTGQTCISTRWAQVFAPLQQAIAQHALPLALLEDLLSAFEQDVRHTQAAQGYATRAQLLAYCRLSANPVGRLLLHLYGITDTAALRQSDAICSALQLINFWQDLSEDLPRGRFYLPEHTCQRHGLERQHLLAAAQRQSQPPAIEQAIARAIEEEMQAAQTLMHQGQTLALRLPGRLGWELRLVVQGGLCIARKVLAQPGASIHTRLTVGTWDVPGIGWRALRMG
ncbi:MAG: squalene synthase HpnC [Comamonas sp.]|nr:squalene synthase HpnC [Comamonas sp.]